MVRVNKWTNPDRLCESCGRQKSHHTTEQVRNCKRGISY